MNTTITRFCAALFLSVLLSTSGYTQAAKSSGKIFGKVFDEKHALQAFASVNLLNPLDRSIIKGSITNENGVYQFDNLPAGNYLIAITVSGYAEVSKGPFSISDADQSFDAGDALLTVKQKQLKEVTVVSKKPLIERKIDKTVVNVENSSLAAGNSALEILARSPGVTVDQSGNITMRGKQGVSVMLDGKLTYLSGEQLASLLKATQGTSIQSIELITNPSAKYDASGSAGLINIRLKKNKSYGTNGTLNAGIGVGNYFKENAGINLNHRQKLFNLYGSYNFSNNEKWRNLHIDRISRNGLSTTAFSQQTNVVINDNSNTYKAGIDYFINKRNTLGFMLNGSTRNGDDRLFSNTAIGGVLGLTDSSVWAVNPAERHFRNTGYNLNFKSVLDSLGQELNIDLDYVKYNNRTANMYNNQFFNEAGQNSGKPFIFRSTAPSVIEIIAGKMDYTYLFNAKTKIEAGVKSSFVKTDNNINFENLQSGNWKNDPGRTNQFVYDENINAGYVNFSHNFKSTSIEAGLRAEQTNSKGNSITAQKLVNRNYIDFFPSFFVNQVLSAGYEIGFAYSRRVDRPNYADLNPFVSNFDLYTFAQGNPYLKPQYTNSFELSATLFSDLYATAGYSKTSDVITEVSLPDTAKKTLFVSKQNLATQESYNLNLSYPLQITKWWSVDNNVNVFYNRFSTPNLLGSPFKKGMASVNINIYQTFDLSKSTKIEASFLYISPQVQGTYHIGQFCYGDLGIKRAILKNKGSLKLAMDDVFNSHRERIRSVIPGQDYRIFQKFETRVVRVSFSYRFGSKEIKDARRRRVSTTSEERRIN
jgi:outer membrane receptor protein involved in Fe transport